MEIQAYEGKRETLERLISQREGGADLWRRLPVDTVAYWLRSTKTPEEIADILLPQKKEW